MLLWVLIFSMLWEKYRIVRGGATVILAMGDGKRAAHEMDQALSNA